MQFEGGFAGRNKGRVGNGAAFFHEATSRTRLPRPPTKGHINSRAQRRTRGTPNPQVASTQLCTRVWTMYWRVALLVLLTTSVPQAKAEPPDQQTLRLLNHYRQLAGLTPVKLDRKL